MRSTDQSAHVHPLPSMRAIGHPETRPDQWHLKPMGGETLSRLPPHRSPHLATDRGDPPGRIPLFASSHALSPSLHRPLGAHPGTRPARSPIRTQKVLAEANAAFPRDPFARGSFPLRRARRPPRAQAPPCKATSVHLATIQIHKPHICSPERASGRFHPDRPSRFDVPQARSTRRRDVAHPVRSPLLRNQRRDSAGSSGGFRSRHGSTIVPDKLHHHGRGYERYPDANP